MISDREARLIAENPDGCGLEEIRALIWYIKGRNQAAARRLWGVRPGFRPVIAVRNLRNYLIRTLYARKSRLNGRIGEAQMLEAQADRYYTRLPEEVKW